MEDGIFTRTSEAGADYVNVQLTSVQLHISAYTTYEDHYPVIHPGYYAPLTTYNVQEVTRTSYHLDVPKLPHNSPRHHAASQWTISVKPDTTAMD